MYRPYNLKISFFNQDYQNIQIYICEFIVNKQSDLLLEVLIEWRFDLKAVSIAVLSFKHLRQA